MKSYTATDILKSYTATDIFKMLNDKKLLTPEVMDVFYNLPEINQFVIAIELNQEGFTADAKFRPEDITVIKPHDKDGFQKTTDNCKRVLERLGDCFITSPTTLEFGPDMASTLTLKMLV